MLRRAVQHWSETIHFVKTARLLSVISVCFILGCNSAVQSSGEDPNAVAITAIENELSTIDKELGLVEANALQTKQQITDDLSETRKLLTQIEDLRAQRLAASESFPSPGEISKFRSAEFLLNELITRMSVEAEKSVGLEKTLSPFPAKFEPLLAKSEPYPTVQSKVIASKTHMTGLQQIVADEKGKLDRGLSNLKTLRAQLSEQLAQLSSRIEELAQLTERQGKLATIYDRENQRLNLLKLDYDNLRLALLSSRRNVRRDLHTTFEMQRLQWKENETEWLLNASKDEFVGAIKSGRALSLYQLEISILATLVDDFLTSQQGVLAENLSEDDAARLAFYTELEKTVLIDRDVLEQLNCSLGAAGAKTRLGMRFQRDGKSITLVPRNWPRLFLVGSYRPKAQKLSEQLDQIGELIAISNRTSDEQSRLENLLSNFSQTVDSLEEKRRADQPIVSEGNVTNQGMSVTVFNRLDDAVVSVSDLTTNDWIYASKTLTAMKDSYRFLSGEKGQICLGQPSLRDYEGQVSLLQLMAYMSRRGIYYGDVITDNDIRQHEMALSDFRRLHDFMSNRGRRMTEDHLARLPTFKERRETVQNAKSELAEVSGQVQTIKDTWSHEETVKYLTAWGNTAEAISNVAKIFHSE